MRDFRDAKAMAGSLREALAAKTITLSHSESLELVSRMLGLPDWNTLSARIQADRPAGKAPAAASYPIVPVRDHVAFPAANTILFVGRPGTMLALDQAFSQGRREVVVVAQRDAKIDQPGQGDLYTMGVLGRLMEVLKLPAADGRGASMKILVHGQRRVAIRRVEDEAGALRAEIEDIHEGPFPEAPDLVRKAHQRFEALAEVRKLPLPDGWPRLNPFGDPGRLADLIIQQWPQPTEAKQAFLEMLDPVERLEKAAALLEADPLAA